MSIAVHSLPVPILEPRPRCPLPSTLAPAVTDPGCQDEAGLPLGRARRRPRVGLRQAGRALPLRAEPGLEETLVDLAHPLLARVAAQLAAAQEVVGHKAFPLLRKPQDPPRDHLAPGVAVPVHPVELFSFHDRLPAYGTVSGENS